MITIIIRCFALPHLPLEPLDLRLPGTDRSVPLGLPAGLEFTVSLLRGAMDRYGAALLRNGIQGHHLHAQLLGRQHHEGLTVIESRSAPPRGAI